ncbi:MAG: HEPN domain-containing protein [Candidatus Sumerlaeota bacterium]|nr:HEPN domain-containing protein [Candidatus Sumerlaeota bacterium]
MNLPRLPGYSLYAMINVAKQVEYSKSSAEEDLAFAGETLKAGKTRYGLFFAHLALEKALKAHVCQATQDLAPKTHDLVKLARIAGVNLDVTQIQFLGRVNAYCIEGRYPELLTIPPSGAEAWTDWNKITEIFRWLIGQL